MNPLSCARRCAHLSMCLWVGLTASFRPAVADPGPWPRHEIDRSSRGADGVRLADLNGDRRLDIATGWEEGGMVRVYLHPGPADVRDPWPAVTVARVGTPEDAVFVDLDQNGRLDVVSCCEGQTRSVFVHWGPTDSAELLIGDRWTTGVFPQFRGKQLWMYACPWPAASHNGHDLVVGSKGEQAGIWLLRADHPARDLATWQAQKLREAGWIMSLLAWDMDGDHDPDLVCTDRRGPRSGAFWLQNPGPAAVLQRRGWSEHAIGATQKEAMFLTVGDVDLDGLADVVVMTLDGHLEYCRRTGLGPSDWHRGEISLPAGHRRGKGIGIGDIDGDARPDFVVTTEDGCVAWHRSDPTRTSATASWFDIGGPVGYKFDRLELLDLDEDGDLDVLTCEERDNLGVVWYENQLYLSKRNP